MQGRVAGLWLPLQGLTWFARFVASVAFNMPADGRGSQAVARAAQGDAREGRGGRNRRWTDGVWFLPPLRFQFKWPSIRPSIQLPPTSLQFAVPIPVRATAFGYNLVFQAAAPQNAFHSASNFVSFSVFSFWFSVAFFFDFPFSCCACCSAIMFTSCKWPNANRKLYMEINYDTNATNERTRHDRISPFSLCVCCCAV